ncbi:MAG: CatB-related O-acetyltransferase [Bacteroidota bacterium]
MIRLFLRIFDKVIHRTRSEQRGRVMVSGIVRGLDKVRFEGNNAVLGFSNFNGNVEVGYATTFGVHNLIHGDIQIGKYCQFGPYAAVNTYNHPKDHLSTYINKRLLDGLLTQYKTSDKTFIGNDVWVGKNAIILGGVTIGNGAIIAAGSVVTKDVPPYHIAGGVPAKILKPRFSRNVMDQIEALEWWDKSEKEIEELKPLFEKNLSGLNSIYE